MNTTAGEVVSSGLEVLTLVDPQLANGAGHQRVPATDPRPWPAGEPLDLSGLQVAADGRMLGLDEFTGLTHGTSLLVVVDGALRYEWYAPGVAADSALLGASMTKSVLAHLVAQAAGRGQLNLGDQVERYVPELGSGGYAEVTIAQLLSMTSGVAWAENYRDPSSPAVRLLGCFGGEPGSSRDLLCEIDSEAEPGSRFAYNSADSQVLDWVRERATGQPALDALTALWADLGCTRDAWLLNDAEGVALAGGGLAASASDWARVAALQLTGAHGGARLPQGWPDRSSRPSRPFLHPGRLPSSITTHAGFGYHWWPLDEDGRQVMADGSRGQFCYLDRNRGVVVVKTSRWPYGDVLVDRTRRDLCYLALPAIAEIVEP